MSGIATLNISDSSELQIKKINENFSALVSSLTNGMVNFSIGSGSGTSSNTGSIGYYNAIRDRLEFDNVFIDHLDANYVDTKFLNADVAWIDTLTVPGTAKIANAVIETAMLKHATITELAASEAFIDTLINNNLFAENATVQFANVLSINADNYGYYLLTEQPIDWTNNWQNYWTDNNYEIVTGNEPIDWFGNWRNYYTISSGTYVKLSTLYTEKPDWATKSFDVYRKSYIKLSDKYPSPATGWVPTFNNTDFYKYSVNTVINARQLMAQAGWFTEINAQSGTFTGKLTATEIDGGLITAGTIIADKIFLRDTQDPTNKDGLLYQLNAEIGQVSIYYDKLTSSTQPEDWTTHYTNYYKLVDGEYVQLTELETYEANKYYKKGYKSSTGTKVLTEDEVTQQLSGSTIIKGTIEADAVKVTDLSAFNATIAGFEMNNGDNNTIKYIKSPGISVNEYEQVNGTGIYLGGSSGIFYVSGSAPAEVGSTASKIHFNPAANSGKGRLEIVAQEVDVSEDFIIGSFKWDTDSSGNLDLIWIGN